MRTPLTRMTKIGAPTPNRCDKNRSTPLDFYTPYTLLLNTPYEINVLGTQSGKNVQNHLSRPKFSLDRKTRTWLVSLYGYTGYKNSK